MIDLVAGLDEALHHVGRRLGIILNDKHAHVSVDPP
jgi:hypothetical protein